MADLTRVRVKSLPITTILFKAFVLQQFWLLRNPTCNLSMLIQKLQRRRATPEASAGRYEFTGLRYRKNYNAKQ